MPMVTYFFLSGQSWKIQVSYHGRQPDHIQGSVVLPVLVKAIGSHLPIMDGVDFLEGLVLHEPVVESEITMGQIIWKNFILF